MPKVQKKSNLVTDPNNLKRRSADPSELSGRLVLVTGSVENAADDLAGSTYHLCDLPSNALLHHDTFFAAMGDGFAKCNVGTATSPTVLLSAAKGTAPLAPFTKGGAHHGAPLWQVLGLEKDPGGSISIFKHAEADAANAGVTKFQIAYLTH